MHGSYNKSIGSVISDKSVRAVGTVVRVVGIVRVRIVRARVANNQTKNENEPNVSPASGTNTKEKEES